jgi:hypothetical protein
MYTLRPVDLVIGLATALGNAALPGGCRQGHRLSGIRSGGDDLDSALPTTAAARRTSASCSPDGEGRRNLFARVAG